MLQLNQIHLPPHQIVLYDPFASSLLSTGVFICALCKWNILPSLSRNNNMSILGVVVQTTSDEEVCPVTLCVVMKHHSREFTMISFAPPPTKLKPACHCPSQPKSHWWYSAWRWSLGSRGVWLITRPNAQDEALTDGASFIQGITNLVFLAIKVPCGLTHQWIWRTIAGPPTHPVMMNGPNMDLFVQTARHKESPCLSYTPWYFCIHANMSAGKKGLIYSPRSVRGCKGDLKHLQTANTRNAQICLVSWMYKQTSIPTHQL